MTSRILAACAVIATACGGEPPANVPTSSSAAPVKIEGTVTELDFGCWADRTCAVRIDDTWVVLPSRAPGGADEEPHGRLVDIALSGGSATELSARYVGRRAEAYGVPTPVLLDGRVAYDAKKLSLGGSVAYYLRVFAR